MEKRQLLSQFLASLAVLWCWCIQNAPLHDLGSLLDLSCSFSALAPFLCMFILYHRVPRSVVSSCCFRIVAMLSVRPSSFLPLLLLGVLSSLSRNAPSGANSHITRTIYEYITRERYLVPCIIESWQVHRLLLVRGGRPWG